MDELTKVEIELLKTEIASLRTDVQDLLYLWNQGKGVLNFIKATVFVGAAIGGFFAFIKPFLK